jgi:TatD DNase family protein
VYDTHCHLTFDHFRGNLDSVRAEAAAVGVKGMITVATTSADCAAALAIAEQYDNVWCSAGVHPLHSDEPLDWDAVHAAGRHEKCVAWGELGLDNHYDRPARAIQDRVLEAQLRFLEARAAEGLVKPVIVHCREAFDDLIAAFKGSTLDPTRYVFHCFTAGPDEARKVLDFGAHISFTGVVTFKGAPEVAEAATLVPEDRIMVETDAPFLSPEPVRKERPNAPKNVVHTARRIAELRGVDYASFERTLDANAERFFGLNAG